jgi:hypothetical protein
MKNTVFFYVIPFRLVELHRRFRVIYELHHRRGIVTQTSMQQDAGSKQTKPLNHQKLPLEQTAP